MKSDRKIDRNLPLDVLMRQWPASINVFIKLEIHCVGCALSPFHCLQDAARLHNIDEDVIVGEIIKSSETKRSI